jgi:hypothetical protein
MQKQVSFERFFDEFRKRVHRELATGYVEGTIHWVNTIYDGAWFKTTERLDRGLVLFREGKISIESMRMEEEIFFDELQEYTQKYLRHKRLDPRSQFIKSLNQGDNHEKAMAI